MTMDQILTFLGVYHAGSYQKAAEQLYLPQSTVSNRIKQLERELDKLLFIRSKAGIKLTEEGHIFLPYAQNAVSSIEEGRLAVNQLKRGLSGMLTIGCNNSFAGSFLPRVLTEFSSNFPEVSIRVLGSITREQIIKMNNNELRLCISRYSLNVPTLTFENIFQEDIRLIVSREHPLANQRFVTMEQIVAEPFISNESDTLHRKTLELTLGHLNLSHQIKNESNNLPLIKHWIKEGSGVFLSGALLFRDEILRGEVVALPIENNPFLPDKVFLMYKNENLNNLEQLFVKHITRMMRIETENGAVGAP
ncbi:LysR family transcriptional regulator [Paenibacillus sp. GP183]|uniref:LysR family transcriptional regulator n=1 Tax=Paenibacillus sp. GP183 TaxID=1882751 RepID=UPI000899EEAB|nr:LysR family transcriptional regulator [Paenibacillus sp. GP183]SEC82769.1 LysR family transcriptional regulator, cyn operon transcriptional activator [Paenibacillus sp. GP183]